MAYEGDGMAEAGPGERRRESTMRFFVCQVNYRMKQVGSTL